MYRSYSMRSSHPRRFEEDEIENKPREERESRVHYRAASHNNYRPPQRHRVDAASQSPVRDELFVERQRYPPMPDDYEPADPEVILRLKWMDNSARMQRLREHRQKRLINKLEVFFFQHIKTKKLFRLIFFTNFESNLSFGTWNKRRSKNSMISQENRDTTVSLKD